METYRLKIKLGQHEFEAEGPREAVEQQFQSFKELITSLQQQPSAASLAPSGPPPGSSTGIMNPDGDKSSGKFATIFRMEGRVVSLTAPPGAVEDAALLILLGQRLHRGNETPTASEIADGLRRSGYVVADRVDRILDSFRTEALLIKMGRAKGTRYRLTNTGIARAENIAREVEKAVA